MKKFILLLSVSVFAVNAAFTQDDELPPPSSKPKKEETKNDQKPPDPKDFQGFQNKKKKFDWNKIIIEPNFNFSIDRSFIDVGLSPYVGYKIFEPEKSKENGNNTGLFAGGGLIYRFTQVSVQTEPNYLGQVIYGKGKFHTYGGGVFLQYNIWRGFFARTKFELVHRSGDDLFQGIAYPTSGNGLEFPKLNKTIPALLIGVGYNLLRSKNFFFPIMVSYNVLQNAVDTRYSLYRSGLVVQLGFVNIF